MKTGYAVSRSRNDQLFFTAQSAYDRPQWVAVTEATSYPTAELAAAAAKKLWKYGAYQACVVPLSEAYDNTSDDEDALIEPMVDVGDDADVDMELGHMEGPCPECDCDPCECVDADSCMCPECDCDPCECPTDDMDGDDTVDGMDLGADEYVPDEDVDGMDITFGPKGTKMAESADKDRTFQTYAAWKRAVKAINPSAEFYGDKDIGGAKGIGEWDGETGVIFSQVDRDKMAQREHANRARDVREATEVNFKDPVGTETPPTTDLTYATAMAHSDKVQVPQEIKKQLSDVITSLEKQAEISQGRDDARSSFCATAASALKQIEADLALGTVDGIKQAQIHMTSFMNPITAHIPEDVVKFIARGGRKSSLKDLFGAKWDKKRYGDVL